MEPQNQTPPSDPVTPKPTRDMHTKRWIIIGASLVLACIIWITASLIIANASKSASISNNQAAKQVSTVTINDAGGFSPSQIGVTHGTTVTWVNNDSEPHELLARDTDGKTLATFGLGAPLAPKDTYACIFDTPGTYYIYDKADPSVTTTVVVQ